MATDLNYENENADLCQIKPNDELGEFPTLRGLINALQEKLRKEKEERPEWESTKTLEKNLTLLEAEYTGIATVVETYNTAYEGFKNQLSKYENCYCTIVSLTNDPGTEELQKAIDKLKKDTYDSKKSCLKNDYRGAWETLNKLPYKGCLEQTKLKVSTQADNAKGAGGAKKVDPLAAMIEADKVKGTKEEFFAVKDYKSRIEAWFADLEALQMTIDKLKEPANFGKRYAYRLEYVEILNEVRPLEQVKKAHNSEWLKERLTDAFKAWLYAVHKYFCWHKDYINKEKNLEKAWLKYEEFLKNRRTQFVSEAEEVKSSDIKCN